MSPISPVLRAREVARYTCIRGFTGRQQIRSAVFDATTLSPLTLTPPTPYVTIFGAGGTTQFYVPVGSFLTKSTTDPTKVKVYQGLGANANAVQAITETGGATGGTLTLTYGGQTATVPYNATAGQIATALAALSSVGSSANLTTAGGPLGTAAVTVTFQGLLGNQPQNLIVANGAGLTGGAPVVTVTNTTTGASAEQIIGVFDGPDKDFFGNGTIAYDEVIPVYFHAVSFDVSKMPSWAAYGAAAQTALPSCTFY